MSPELIEFYQEIARNLAACKHGEKQKFLNDCCEKTGLSMQALYRNLANVGYKSGRKTRADRGSTDVNIEEARMICSMINLARKKNDKRELSFENAIEIAYASGACSKKYSISSISRIAKMYGFHPDQLAKATPHQNMRSLHPNHVWQVDASIGNLFYLPAGGIEFFDERLHYKNKPENMAKVSRSLCIRYIVTDHYSGAIYVKYYSASGENSQIFFDVLVSAFEPKEDGIIMQGVPQILIMDKGSANTSHAVLKFLDKMQISHWAHSTGNSRAKGQVENAQNIVERDFEGRLKFTTKKIANIDEMNEAAKLWMLHYNSNKTHSRHGRSRYEMWSSYSAEQLRIAPSRQVMETLLTAKPSERTVRGDLTITYKVKGHEQPFLYSVEHIENIRVKEKVLVTINPYRSPNVDVIMTDIAGIEHYYECQPLDIDDAGFRADAPVFGEEIRAKSDTITDIERKAGLMAGYDGAETLEEAKKAEKQGHQLYGGKLDPMRPLRESFKPDFIQRKGVEMEIDVPKQVFESISVAEACKRIKAQLGSKYQLSLYGELSKKYPNGIDPTQLDAIVAEIKAPKPSLKIVN